MKKFLLFLCAALLALAGCSRFDDLEKTVDDLDSRVSTLEELVEQMNSQISAIDALVNTISNGGYITDVKEESRNGINWYTITLSNGKTYTVHDGADGTDGKDGHTPAVGVKLDEDGNWYWTVDGEYTSPKVQVNGKDGQTPELSIISGYWCIRWPGDEYWTTLSKAQGEDGKDGDAFFADIQVGEDEVTFTLADGETFSVSVLGPFRLVCESTAVGVAAGQQAKVKYTVKGVKEAEEVVVYVKYTSAGWSATVDEASCTLAIDVPANPAGGLVIIEAINNSTSQVADQAIRFEDGILSAATFSYEISDASATIEIPFETNMNYEVECDAEWLVQVPQTKAAHTEVLVFQAELNKDADDRNASVTITGATGDKITISVLQRGCPPLKDSYELGEYYERQGVAGIVWYCDEECVKVLSMTEKRYVKFSEYSSSNSWADSKTDGLANMNTLLKNEYLDIEWFPAYKWCHELGEGWYLPAEQEMIKIMDNYDALSKVLSANGGDSMFASMPYWSSTQDTNTKEVSVIRWDWDVEGGASTMMQQTGSATARASYKVNFKEDTETPEEPKIEIGTAMTIDGGEGVVAYVDETGEHGYIIHKDQSGKVHWATTGQGGSYWSGCASETDGKANCEYVSTWLEMTSSCPGIQWALYSGRSGWFLPAQEQLKAIMANFYKINEGIEKLGGTQLSEGSYYWSSTVYYDGEGMANARTACYVDGEVSAYSEEIQYGNILYARSIHEF
ncbi:MAG: PL29 family lyase N-terminal domain-containing protein [Clostridium sp.]|nr:PL29 family lyase N-terminal domain-containing protein [Bacteroides sp.]MCM1199053.1 PL29 family lyase N-terminal domain-containing protein [Clostridium sp.]